MIFSYKLLLMIIFCSLLYATVSTHAGNSGIYSPEEIIQKIADSEGVIKNLEMHFDYNTPDGDIDSFDWGWEGGKEFMEGKEILPPTKWQSEMVPGRILYSKRAFDGEKLYDFRNDTTNPEYTSGKVLSYTPLAYQGFPRPTTLLGFDVVTGVTTLSAALKNAQNITVRDKNEEIDGNPCVVIEAIGLEGQGIANDVWKTDVRVWIDINRDFRPLKIENYTSIKGKNKWKVTEAVTDGIELKKIDGIWFPVKGRKLAYFRKEVTLPEGMTAEDITKLSSDERKEILDVTVAPAEFGYLVPRIREDSIRINKGIDPQKFGINFPQNCRVHDQFAGIIYEVGSGRTFNVGDFDYLSSTENKDSDNAKITSTQNIISDSNSNHKSDKSVKSPFEYNKEIRGDINSTSLRLIPLFLIAAAILCLITAVFLYIKFKPKY